MELSNCLRLMVHMVDFAAKKEVFAIKVQKYTFKIENKYLKIEVKMDTRNNNEKFVILSNEVVKVPVGVTSPPSRIEPSQRSPDSDWQLISLVEQYPCLWDMTSSDYSNRLLADNAWEQIASQISELPEQKAIDMIKKKWRNIRGCYVRIKNAKLPSGSGATKRKQYKYAESLRFLDEIIKINPTVSTLDTFGDDSPKNADGDSTSSVSDPIRELTTAILDSTKEKPGKYELFGAQVAAILTECTPQNASRAQVAILEILLKYQFPEE